MAATWARWAGRRVKLMALMASAATAYGGQAKFAAKRADLVFEQFAQRLNQTHIHALRQTADIVVRLDRH